MKLELWEWIPPSAKNIAVLGNLKNDAMELFNRRQPKADFILIPSKGQLTETLANNKKTSYDCTICTADFLANADLDNLLRMIYKFTSKDGQIIGEFYNSGYLPNLINAGLGKGNIQIGFGIGEFKQQAAANSLYIDRLEPIYEADMDSVKKLNEMSALIAAFNSAGNLLEIPNENDFWAQKYRFRLTFKEITRKISLAYQLGDSEISARARLIEPNKFAATHPGIFIAEDDIATSKILVRQRKIYVNSESALAEIEAIRKNNGLIIYEIDDLPPMAEEYFAKNNYLDLKGAHAVEVSTPRLADYVREFNPNVKVFLNQLAELPPPRNFYPRDKVTIFMGGIGRDEDALPILPVLNDAAETYGEKLEFKFVKCIGTFLSLESPHKELIGEGNFVPYELYARTLQTVDIALLPLLSSRGKLMKSDLKFIEAAAHGAAVIAAPTIYEDSIIDGKTGFIYHDEAEFKQKLFYLIDHSDFRQQMAKNAYDYVKINRLLSQHYMERVNFYHECFDNYANLDKQLEKRLQKFY